jgi:hypothetical protein
MAVLSNLLQIVLPKKKTPPGGTSLTNTFNPAATTQVLGRPSGRDHLTDIFSDRTTLSSADLMQSLFKNDPDVSATVHAYLTVANTDPWFLVRDVNGKIDRPGSQVLNQIIASIFVRNDYTLPQPFALKQNLRSLCADFRYLLLLRGGIGAELVLDKTLRPTEIRNVDMNTINWFETAPGVFLPQQTPKSSSTKIDMNIPSFFVSFYRRDPTKIYTESAFVAAINTIASRQQIINDLYRIMQITGYPRLDITVIEEVLRKNAPAEERSDDNKMKAWMSARIAELGNSVSNLRPDQAFTHFDSVKIDVVNSGGPAKSMDVSEVIKVLNAQNQAALKVVSTVIGRGESGVNTASVEARIFSLSAEEVNYPVAELLSNLFTFALRLTGSQSTVEVGFDHVELRPATELEPQLLVKQGRLLTLLSYGLIDDDTFHLEMFNQPKPDGIQDFSGTRFYQGTEPTPTPSPNSDPLGRSISAPGSNAAKNPAVKK